MPDVTPDSQLRDFFLAFGLAGDELDLVVLERSFAEVFMAADPAGVQAVPRAAFLAFLPKRAGLFAAAGVTSVSLRTLEHRALDAVHELVDTEWVAERGPASAHLDPVPLASTFIVRREPEGLRIVFYLNHQEIGKVLAAVADAR